MSCGWNMDTAEVENGQTEANLPPHIPKQLLMVTLSFIIYHFCI